MFQDLRFALRLLVKDRTFTITAFLTLALCIGANAAILSIVRSVVLKPLPVSEPERLMHVYDSYPRTGAVDGGASAPDHFDRLKAAPAFDELALYRRVPMTFGAAGGAERLVGVRATPSFYRMLRAAPQAGRVFTDAEGEYGNHHVVILSDGFWRRNFASDRGIVGQTILLGGSKYDVVGVMPAGFRFIWNDVDLWMPEAFTDEQKADDARHYNPWDEIGRLKPGATVAQAQAQLDAIATQNDQRMPQFREFLQDAGYRTVVVPLQDHIVHEIRPVLFLLWGGVLLLLLLGSVNIANLVLTRSAGRTRELATRFAIGAHRGRLGRQLLTETTLLALVGGGIGLVAGWWALGVITAMRLDNIPRAYEITLDPVTTTAILSSAVLVGLLVGLVPLVRLSRMNLHGALTEGGRGGTGGRGANLLRRALAVAQVAMAFVLLVGAGLLVASFREVLRIDPGFDPSGVITASTSLSSTKGYRDDDAVVEFTNEALAAIRALPGVEAAGTTCCIPFGGKYNDADGMLPEGYTPKKGESAVSPYFSPVSDGYFEAMRVPLVRGRFFTASDTDKSQRVVIVDEALAERFWPGLDPIGRTMVRPASKDTSEKRVTVVGVVKPVRLTGLVEQEKRAGAYYYPQAQFVTRTLVFAVRVRGNPENLTTSLRKAVAAVDPQLPFDQVRTMEDRLDMSLVSRKVPMQLAMGFGAIALLLSAIGVYGVLAYGVSQRRREIAIRMALGSTPGGVFGLVLGDGAWILGVGLAIGMAGTLAASRTLQTLLYGVQPMDPVVIGVVGALLSVVAIVAIAIPARRAARVSPTVALSDH